MNFRVWSLLALLALAALMRFIPHPPNFAPMTAMVFTAPLFFRGRSLALVLPLFFVFLTDAILGFYQGMVFVYLAYVFIAGLGFFQKHLFKGPYGGLTKVFGLSVNLMSGAAVFFVLSNLGVWLSAGLYPRTLEGLLDCFVLAIPFFQNTLFAHLFYSFVLMLAYSLALKLASSRQPQSQI